MSRDHRSILVTGGQGFTGRHLIARWLADDPDIRIVAAGRSSQLDDRFTGSVTWDGAIVPAPLPAALRVAGDRYSYRKLDLLDTHEVTALLVENSIDTVVHLAGSLRDSPFDALVRNNIAGTQSLLEAVRAAGRDDLRTVICSSGSVFGTVAEHHLPIGEDICAAPVDLYSVTKRAAEDLASVHRRAHGLDVIVARIFNIIGPGEDERHLAPHLARQFAQRKAGLSTAIEVGPLDTTRDFVDVRDVAAALIAIARNGQNGDLLNVASGVESGTREVFDILNELSGGSETYAAAKPARDLDFARQRADISRLRALGFRPAHTLRESLAAMLTYYLDDVAAVAERARAADGGSS